MSYTEEQIERIVRRVLTRLGELAGEPGRSPAPATPANSEQAPPARSLDLDDKVISTAQLEDRLEGISQVTVARGAVVTPAARDLLKERSVELRRA